MALETHQARLYELDWARVVLVFAVFLHHVGMPFNGDGFVVMNDQSSKALDDVMVYFEQLRLPTLFMIAGAGSYLLLRRLSVLAFLNDKIRRLLIPLVFGVMVVVPPQLYYANPDAFDGLFAAYPGLALELDAMHLWFIEFLFAFFVLAGLLMAVASRASSQRRLDAISGWMSGPQAPLVLAGALVITRVTLKHFWPDESKGLENLSVSGFYLFFFLAGFLWVRNRDSWLTLSRRWRHNAVTLMGVSILFYAYYFIDLSGYASNATLWAGWWALCALLSWYGALTILGVGQRFLRSTPAWLMRANRLIYPFYIFHQTVIVVVGYYVIQWSVFWGVKAVVLLIISLVVTTLITLLFDQFRATRWLVGLR